MRHGPSRLWQIGVAALGAVLMVDPPLSAQIVLQPVGKPIRQPGSGRVSSLHFSPDCKKLLSNGLHLCNVDTTTIVGLMSVPAPYSRILEAPDEVLFTPDSKTLIVFTQIYVQRWDAIKGKPVAREVALIPSTAPLKQYLSGPIALRPDGKVMLAHHLMKVFKPGVDMAETKYTQQQGLLVNPTTGQRVGSALAYVGKGKLSPNADVRACSFTPDGKQIITFHENGAIRIWDGATGKLKAKDLTHPDAGAHQLHISPDGKTFSTVGGYSIQRWDLASGEALGAPLKAAGIVAFSPDGKMLAMGGKSRTNHDIAVVDAATGKIQASWLLKSDVRELKFNPDGKILLSVAQDYAVSLWEPTTGKLLAVVQQQTQGLPTAAFSPDGKLLATSTYDRPLSLIHLWRLP